MTMTMTIKYFIWIQKLIFFNIVDIRVMLRLLVIDILVCHGDLISAL